MPVIITGDFNCPPDPSASTVLSTHLASGRWFDCAQVAADAQGTTPDPTCYTGSPDGPEGRSASRIDLVLANHVAISGLETLCVSDDKNIPTHRQVDASFGTLAYRQRVDRLAVPAILPLRRVGRDEKPALREAAAKVCDTLTRQWDSAGNVEERWQTWCSAASSFLAVHACEPRDAEGSAKTAALARKKGCRRGGPPGVAMWQATLGSRRGP